MIWIIGVCGELCYPLDSASPVPAMLAAVHATPSNRGEGEEQRRACLVCTQRLKPPLPARKLVVTTLVVSQRSRGAAGAISFAELDASVRGWINHVRDADTWGLRKTIFKRARLVPARLDERAD